MKHLFKTLYSILLVTTFTACNSQPSSKETAAKTEEKQAPSALKKSILYFGDSLTAGYGLEDPADAYPNVVQLKIDSAGLPYRTINGGISGETSAGGLGRIDWLLKQPIDVFILELGANDGLRGIPIAETTKNLQAIIDKVKAKYPNAKLVLLGMQVPPNMGTKYVNDFKEMFPELASKNKMALVPFLLQGVGGMRKLNQPDGIHPTAEGAKILAANVWQVLKNVL
jgi:acyl-CoA thioesterase-1